MTMFKKPLFYTVISCLLISWCSLWTNNTNNENTPQPNNENGITKESENSPEQNIEINNTQVVQLKKSSLVIAQPIKDSGMKLGQQQQQQDDNFDDMFNKL